MNVYFTGAVSAQSQVSERVYVEITKPDWSKVDANICVTQADLTFSTYADLPVGPGYTAVAKIDPDGAYKGAVSPEVPFEVGLERTISLSVSMT